MDDAGCGSVGCCGFGNQLVRAQEVQCQEEVQGCGSSCYYCEQDDFSWSGFQSQLVDNDKVFIVVVAVDIGAMNEKGSGSLFVLHFSFGSYEWLEVCLVSLRDAWARSWSFYYIPAVCILSDCQYMCSSIKMLALGLVV